MGVQACRLPGLKPLKPLQRFLKIFLARPTPQATGTPRPDQWPIRVVPFYVLQVCGVWVLFFKGCLHLSLAP